MYRTKQTDVFSNWIFNLKDIKAKVSILRKTDRIKLSNFGDYKAINNNISELRIQTSRI